MDDVPVPVPVPVPVRKGRGRRPADEARRAALTATAALLFDGGLASVTFDRVAARAGVSKMTLYKWWPSPGALALDAYFDAVEVTLAFPDTGDLARDMGAQLHAFVRLITQQRGGAVIAELVGAAQMDRDLAAALAVRYTRPCRQLAVDAFARAQQRGQIRADIELEVLVDQLWGACYHRLLLPDQPIDDEFADALIGNLLDGIRPEDSRGSRSAAN